MFESERLTRVARAIGDEMHFRRYGFMPHGDVVPDRNLIMMARVAILAADGDVAVLDRLRRTREIYQIRLLGADATEESIAPTC